MDLPAAADYSGVPVPELLAAAVHGTLHATLTHPRRPSEWMVRLEDVEHYVQSRHGEGFAG